MCLQESMHNIEESVVFLIGYAPSPLIWTLGIKLYTACIYCVRCLQ